jgi:(E)-4-hydroxy-3-methylbut-2-enyl-diphosphate synthase
MKLIERKKTKEVKVGDIVIGGNNPVIVQSMCNTKTNDTNSTINQIKELSIAGCEIIRVAVSDIKSAEKLKIIKKSISIPLVADIHFDYKLAIKASEYADKIRINPGNIGGEDKVKKVIDACKKNNCAIRIGVNLGSIDKKIEKKFGRTPRAMVESALEHIRFFEKNNFTNIIISLKASDVITTIEANKLLSKKCDYPIHLGITEAGTINEGTIKSSVGIGSLLSQGIGDTIRVSLTSNPVEEIPVCYSILRALELRKGRIFVSCPTCGRTHGNLIDIANTIEKETRMIDKNITIAVMGCEVNGPGEAKNADIGVALSKDYGFIFKKGEIIKKIKHKEIVKILLFEIDKI